MNWNGYAIAAVVIWNAAVFALYALDKSKAKRGARRISEKTLLLAAALLGGLGALLGMCVCRHKTKHLKFTLGVPLLLLMNLVIVFAVIKYIL